MIKADCEDESNPPTTSAVTTTTATVPTSNTSVATSTTAVPTSTTAVPTSTATVATTTTTVASKINQTFFLVIYFLPNAPPQNLTVKAHALR